MKYCVIAVLFLACLCACASTPAAEKIATADYGDEISQIEAQAQAEKWLKSHLKDPHSAQIDWGVVQKGWTKDAPIQGGGFQFGYKLDVQVNAKNSFGGYTGYKPYIFLFFNGDFKRIFGQDELDAGVTYLRRYE